MNVSSMVSELAPVVLYLRYVVRTGNVLIIEEPEAHLHPKMQVEFTRQLAAAVKAGVRVIATTHSEWILEELANLVWISGIPEAEREAIDRGIALEPHEVRCLVVLDQGTAEGFGSAGDSSGSRVGNVCCRLR